MSEPTPAEIHAHMRVLANGIHERDDTIKQLLAQLPPDGQGRWRQGTKNPRNLYVHQGDDETGQPRRAAVLRRARRTRVLRGQRPAVARRGMSEETTPGPDLCIGCMTRERQRDGAIEAARLNGIKGEQAKAAWYREKDRADKAEAERDRLDVRMEEIVEGFKNAHNCHRTDQSGILCATCHTRYPCPTARALDAIGDQASDVVAERDQLKAAVARVKALADDMRAWCSPHGIAVLYAQRIDEAIEPPEPVGIEADSEAEFAAKLGAIMRKHRAEVHPEHAEACANCAVIKGAPEVLAAGLGDLPAVREFAADFDPRKEPPCPTT